MSDTEEPTPPPVQAMETPPESGVNRAFDQIVPAKNPPALFAYYVAVFSLIPCLALVLGPIAVVLGLKGLKAIRENPQMPGKAHALFAIVFGGLMTLVNVVAILWLVSMAQYKP